MEQMQEGQVPVRVWDHVDREDFPSGGRMLVPARDRSALWWLADRHAVLEGAGVVLEGAGRRLMEARADEHGLVDWRQVREYDAGAIEPVAPVLRWEDPEGAARAEAASEAAVALWRLREYAQEALYPPYIAESTMRPKQPFLQPPLGLHGGAELVIARTSEVPEYWEIFWSAYPGTLETEFVMSAALHSWVVWGSERYVEAPGPVAAQLFSSHDS